MKCNGGRVRQERRGRLGVCVCVLEEGVWKTSFSPARGPQQYISLAFTWQSCDSGGLEADVCGEVDKEHLIPPRPAQSPEQTSALFHGLNLSLQMTFKS